MIERYNEWLNNEFIDKEDKEILKNMTDREIEESFYNTLKFGTAGIRGIMGLGTSKMNKYTIGKVTVGLSNYLNKNYDNPSVVIAFDTRNNSKEFAYLTARILNYYKIKTYLFEDYTSTPELAFSVKYLKCSSGIVITSSHNAKIYNGYKVYNSLGGQIVPPEDELIINEINDIDSFECIKLAPLNNELFNVVKSNVHDAFIKENKKALKNEELIKKYGKEIKITYSSLHGVGLNTIKELFNEYGINYNIVKEQCTYDGNFPTAPEPNPEYIENYDLGIKYTNENNSDAIILSDPDADRIGVMVKDNDNYKLLNGNLIGILFAYYIVTNSSLNKDNYLVRSLPSSVMIDKIANKYNIKIKEVLTGCKNIANEKNNDRNNYLFGYEESLGYMFNIEIDDKNAFSSALVFIEILCYLKEKNITILDYIDNIYKEIGYYLDYSISIEYEKVEAFTKMKNLMNDLRENKLKISNIKEKIDYTDRNDNLKTDALKFIFNDDSYLVIRPSGTEPKIKLYFGSVGNTKEESINILNNLKDNIIPLFK